MFPLISGGVKDPMQTALIDPVVVNVPVYQHFPTSYPRGCGKWPKMGLQRQRWADLPGFYSFPPAFTPLTLPAACSHFFFVLALVESGRGTALGSIVCDSEAALFAPHQGAQTWLPA